MYVIINGVSSDTIQGLQVLSLPPITKPKMRRQVDTIDGRAGDIITELGYEAYDRTITVLLHHNYDLDAITAFFNTSGEIIFSNEPDKKYYFRLLEEIDYERAVQFKTANITFHVQPYKYPVNETPLTVSTTAWEGTDYDQTPYIFRAVSDSSVEVGNREIIEQITGGTVAWNQLMKNGNFEDESVWIGGNSSNVTFAVKNNVGTVTALSDGDRFKENSFNMNAVVGHKYLFAVDAQASVTPTSQMLIVSFFYGDASRRNRCYTTDNNWHTYTAILACVAMQYNMIRLEAPLASIPNNFKNAMVIDLTQMFGSTIADYIYSLEQSTAGAGVSLFKSLFPKAYYAYNAGELLSVKASARETVEFNQWDEEWELGAIGGTGANVNATDRIRSKNYIRVIPNATYYYSINSTYGIFAWGYDSNKNYVGRVPSNAYAVSNNTVTIPSDVQYIRIVVQPGYGTTYNNDICINLSKTTGSPKNGDYVPYEKHTYPLSNIELRGISKLVNGKIQYDGDIYKADGGVERRFGIVVINENSAIRQNSTGDTRFYIQKNDMNRRMDYLGYIMCDKLQTTINYNYMNENGFVSGYANSTGYIGQNWIYFSNGEATTIADMKTWLASNPLTVVYELATPTTETTTPYTETQICSPYGTEEFIDDRDVQIPVGHKTRYMQINDPAEIIVPNAGNVPSAPTIQLTGSGAVGVYLGNAQTLQVNIPEDGITIDTEAQDATSNGQLANRSVTGDYDSVRLQPGNNDVSFSGDVSAVITKYTRWV